MTTTSVPATIITSTNDAGSTITTTSPLSTVRLDDGTIISPETTTDKFGNSVVLTGNHKGQVVTTTDARGRTVVLTFTPHGKPVSELVVKTTHLSNGQYSTFTSLAHVGAPSAGSDNDGGSSGSSSPTGKHGLQSGLASPTGRYVGEMAVLFGGAIGVAALL